MTFDTNREAAHSLPISGITASTNVPDLDAQINPNARKRPDVSHFDNLPDAALIAINALAAVLGKGVSTAWRDIRNDPDFPKPIRLSAGCTRFRVGDIRQYLVGPAKPRKPA
jgi:predicted DNA-binding transcriptional regulator AlpA